MALPVEIQPPRHVILEPYRRITSTGNFIPEIDGLRFLAIFSVYVYHLTGDVLRHSPSDYARTLDSNALLQVTQILNVGVPLFFVISGFVLGLPFAESARKLRRPVSLKKYFLRRVTRLEPPYIACLLLFFTLKMVAARGTFEGLLPSLTASIFYLHNSIFGRPSDIEFVAWSLEIEVQFYVLAPLLASFFAINQTLLRRTVLVISVLTTSLVSRMVVGHPSLQLSLLAYAQYFLAGFLLSEYYLDCGPHQKNSFWDCVAILSGAALIVLLVSREEFVWLLMPWLMLSLCISVFRGPMVNWFLINPWITTMGGMCYSIYLLHNYAIAAAGTVTELVTMGGIFPLRLLVQFLLITPFVLATSAVYFRCIERPCMSPDWPQRLRSWSQRMRRRLLLSQSL